MREYFSYITGYVNIVVEGYYIEKFINLCLNKSIYVWNLKREKASILHARININDFKKLKNICKQTKCRVKIEKKNGIPFILYKYKKRKITIIFLILVIASIFIMSNFIWNIEIVGNEKIDSMEIMNILKQEGIDIGKSKMSIDTKDILNEIRFKREDIAWIGFEIKGTNLIVKIVEADEKPEIINEEDYCNIIAKKDAVISKISARKWYSYGERRRCCKKGRCSYCWKNGRKIYRNKICPC